MEQDLICAEGELAIAVNKIERYAESLIECIDEFNEIISSITSEKTLQDVLISAELQNLNEEVSQEKESIAKSVENIKAIVNSEVQEIEDVDKFDYPDFSGDDIKNLLLSFL